MQVAEARDARIVMFQGSVLLVLCLLAFLHPLGTIVGMAVRDNEAAHLMAAPVLVGLLGWLRRRS